MTKIVCLDGGTHHSWERCGLDVRNDKLVSVRRCVWCDKERATTYKERPYR